ncbi:MAG: hypothetical protein HYR60_18295 [Acidobacteria bacterium]|nr:hypothetical protein [Acidobacteriota bacterium]
MIPGELPVYTVTCCQGTQTFPSRIVAREVGMRRVELGNERFRVVIDRGVPAIVEAYSLSAGPQRMLNLVETTPDTSRANSGWSTPGASGEPANVELLETGPLRGRVRLSRSWESWEFVWTAGSAALRWRVRGVRGFRFASVSADPYLPFDRFVDGSEYEWPQGPEEGEPPNHDIAPREWKKLPGGHAVYYRQAENYGALGLVALDARLDWSRIGSRYFEATGAGAESEIALTFPEWKGNNTVLEARRENRVLRQPLVVHVEQASSRPPRAGRGPGPQAVLLLDGDWELSSGDKGAGPQSEWRTVRVPGTVHTQILDAPKYYTREAEWISSREWWYRKRFRLPPSHLERRIRLQFEATDYYADAYCNGHYLGRHEGYIDPYEYDVTDCVQAGENEIRVRVWTPVTYYWRHRPYTIKGAYGAVDQKPDDITPLGITGLAAGPVRAGAAPQELRVGRSVPDLRRRFPICPPCRPPAPLVDLGPW